MHIRKLGTALLVLIARLEQLKRTRWHRTVAWLVQAPESSERCGFALDLTLQ